MVCFVLQTKNDFSYLIYFQNSTFNVSKSTLEVMKEEFRLSLSICEEIIAGKVYNDYRKITLEKSVY